MNGSHPSAPHLCTIQLLPYSATSPLPHPSISVVSIMSLSGSPDIVVLDWRHLETYAHRQSCYKMDALQATRREQDRHYRRVAILSQWTRRQLSLWLAAPMVSTWQSAGANFRPDGMFPTEVGCSVTVVTTCHTSLALFTADMSCAVSRADAT